MDVPVRFELTVLGICSPLHWASLPQHDITLVLPTRIELVIKAYQASVIPFNYESKNLEPMEEVESPTFSFVAKCSNPLSYTGIIMVVKSGFEPPTLWIWVTCSNHLSYITILSYWNTLYRTWTCWPSRPLGSGYDHSYQRSRWSPWCISIWQLVGAQRLELWFIG